MAFFFGYRILFVYIFVLFLVTFRSVENGRPWQVRKVEQKMPKEEATLLLVHLPLIQLGTLQSIFKISSLSVTQQEQVFEYRTLYFYTSRSARLSISRLMEEPTAYEKLRLTNLLELREDCSRELQFVDAYRSIKQRSVIFRQNSNFLLYFLGNGGINI